MALHLCSYNVRYAGLDTGEHAWPRRRDGVAELLRVARPDVICLQEVWREQLADLRERLPDYSWIGRRVLDGEHTPIGYRPDRIALDDWSVFALSETPAALTVPGWDAAVPRITTRATLRTDGGDRLAVFSTHLDHEDERARLEGARLLRDRAAALDPPVVVAGDLNCAATDPPVRKLTAGRLVDARALAATPLHGPSATFTDFGATAAQRDHVLVDRTTDVARVATLPGRDDSGRYPSDHLPVVAALSLPT